MRVYQLTLQAVILLGSCLSVAAELTALVSQNPLELAGKPARFDFMATDYSMNRVLAAHKGAGSLEIYDSESKKLLPAIHVGEIQGVAIDPVHHKYFAGNDGDHSVVAIDSSTFKKLSEIKLDGPVDAIAFDTKNETLYAAEDNGDRLWVIDTKDLKLKATIKIPGVPEVLEYGSKTDRIYLNIKNKDSVVSINPQTNLIEAIWPTAPAKSPHGLALDNDLGQIFVAGGNGKLVAVDMLSGKVVSSVDITSGTDQIAYDPTNKKIYSAGKGAISITLVGIGNLVDEGKVTSPKGAHTIAVDSKTKSVWVVYANELHSFFHEFQKAK